ncbi:MAG: hypothetical protein KatS3mg081_0649 [Gemmatimonadales bacterium]|nr:MAG: hypothetical protein KatS3mg081_0649 [Gemmatimonadales bacterium]
MAILSRAVAVVAILVAIRALPVFGQAVRGQLVDRANGRGVSGAFVVLLDAQEREVARALTDDRGRFLLRAPAAGTYRLQSKRIGFRVTVSPPLVLEAERTISYRLEVDAVPASLPPVIVEGKPQCGTRGEAGTIVARLWEEAKEALAAVSWTEGSRLYQYSLRMFERDLPDVGTRVIRERSWTRSGYAETPFRSAPAEDLAERGYVVEEGRDRVYFAPDAGVLLSEVFAGTHCFNAIPGVGGRIGLSFEPVPERHLPEIKGVLWLDQSTAELRALEFSYSRLPPELPEGPIGGRIEFMRLPTGAWIVREWFIRMPLMGQIVYTEGRREPVSKVMGYRETGGQVLSITDSRGRVIFSMDRAVMEGSVYDTTRGRPLPRALVVLEGTEYSTTADDRGNFHMALPVEGDYQLAFRHPRLDSLGFRPDPVPVSLKRGQRVTVSLGIPAEDRILPRLCPELDPEGDERAIVGRVIKADGSPAAGATVQLEWQTVGGTEGALRARNWKGEVTADSSGSYRACGIPLTAVAVQARLGSAASQPLMLRFTRDGVWVGNRYRSFPGRIWTQELRLGR